jgi:hypothetical protein
MAIRYGLALAIALSIIGGAWYFTYRTVQDNLDGKDEFKQRLKRENDAGTLKGFEEVDIDDLVANERGMPLTTSETVQLDAAAFLQTHWFMLGPLVLLLCFLTARLAGRLARRRA